MIPQNTIFAEIFNCLIIHFSPIGLFLPLLQKGSSNVINHSIQPYWMVSFIELMTFPERIQNHELISLGQPSLACKPTMFSTFTKVPEAAVWV